MTAITQAVRFMSTVHGTTAAIRQGQQSVDGVARSVAFSPKYFPAFLAVSSLTSGVGGYFFMGSLQNLFKQPASAVPHPNSHGNTVIFELESSPCLDMTTGSTNGTQKWHETVDAATAMAKAEKPKGGPSAKAPSRKTFDTLNKTALVSAVTWDIFSPPPNNSFKGKVVPRVVNRYQNRRKVSLEVHKITPPVDPAMKDDPNYVVHSYEECVLRILVPVNKAKATEAKLEGYIKMRLHEGSVEQFDAPDYDDDEGSTSDSALIAATGGALLDTGGKHFDGWKPKYRVPCQSVTIEHQHKRNVHLLVTVGQLKQEREIIFDTEKDATLFCQKLAEEHAKEAIRLKKRLQSSLGEIHLQPFETITILVEVVSGRNLPIGDLTTSDPYVVCYMGKRQLHKTKHISGTLDPVWTVSTGSLFLATIESEELFLQDGLSFVVKDFDQFGADETLGMIHVNPRTVYNAKGERMELKLQPVEGGVENAEEVPGHIAIRIRRATEHDKQFMKEYEGSTKTLSAAKNPKTTTSAIKAIVTKNSKVEDGVKLLKTRPYPDPMNPEETEWMTKKEIMTECMKPSRSWTDAGTGKLGRVYLEILSAEGLPNMDTMSWLGNLTDSFVSVVYEDTVVRTDTIDDCLNPVWLPWSQRAFILNIGHPSSQIFLGIFDYDAGFDDHDLIGRVSVDITNLRPDTEYSLSYAIYPSAIVSGREIQGKINIRLRIEIPDERRFALAVLEPPNPNYVNLKKGKDFRVVRQTCLGKTDVDKYSMSTMKSYIDELSEYQNLLLYIEDALFTLLLWRGHFKVTIGGKEYMLPIHSFNAFVLATFLVEHPQCYPSFCFGCIAWLLLAVMGWRRNNPNEWARCQSFAEIFQKVVFGKSSTPPHRIEAFEKYEETKAALEKWMKRIKDSEDKAQRAYIQAQKEEEQRLKDLEEIGETDADISTKIGGGISIDPIRAALHPVQLLLGFICRILRFVKHVVYWEEAYFSFWITIASAFLSIVCLFVPWFFIIRWTARIVVWLLFGPWMKLVDVYYVSTLKPETDEERTAREELERLERKAVTDEAAKAARLVREEAAKMKEMKRIMFGKFAMKVPILKQDRFTDIPLPESSAKPYEQKALSLAELAMQEAGYNRTRLPGQTLVGDMIPTIEADGFTRAPTGKATASPEKMTTSTRAKPEAKTTNAAYAQIGSIVVVAGVLTFFGVPLLASVAEKAVDAAL
eukprot:Nitzschia sp. Nitz4//scaffold48_size128905//13659//18448//NITZ4_003579-RA/size128905-augustus-gene-0.100-mRNA-1//-1//CDS//3329552919//4669//frame0